jgi:hypothetical protein
MRRDQLICVNLDKARLCVKNTEIHLQHKSKKGCSVQPFLDLNLTIILTIGIRVITGGISYSWKFITQKHYLRIYDLELMRIRMLKHRI